MNSLTRARLLALSLLPVSFALFGCGGAISLPDTVVTSQVKGPAIRGSAFGGHAPIVGMHVYLVQPGTSGYGSAATSLLSGAGTTPNNNGTDPTVAIDPNVPASASYVTTDASGQFNLTGLYTCTAGQPVYIYAYGGSPQTSAPSGYTSTTTANDPISGIVVTKETPNGEILGGYTYTATYTVTVSTPVTITATMVTIDDLNSGGADEAFAILNNSKQTITPVTDSNMFTFSATTNDEIKDGTYTTANFGSNGYATAPEVTTTTNPIVQLATLGNCPDTDTNTTPNTGNFFSGNTALNYVYMNEVSTVATAYTFQPFTLATNNNAWDIGTPGTTQAELGIANAALTAEQLYDIQGRGAATTTPASDDEGEGHIANFQTQLAGGTTNAGINQGNGIVPQATIDTLANILAACIDSSVGTGNSIAAPCTTLFNTATSDGNSPGTTATIPTDTAAAAINIARYPAGNGSGTPDPTYVSGLYSLPGSVVPYAPALTAQPNDFTLAINYPMTSPNAASYPQKYFDSNSELNEPESIAVDSGGHIWITADNSDAIMQWSSLGDQMASDTLGYAIAQVTIDPNDNAWIGNNNGNTSGTPETTGVDEIVSTSTTTDGTTTTTLAATSDNKNFYQAFTLVADDSGNVYVFASDTATDGASYDTNGYSEMFKLSATSGDPENAATARCDGKTNGGAGFVYYCISQPAADGAGASIFTTADDYVGYGAIENASSGGDLWFTSIVSNKIARVTPAGTLAPGFTEVTSPAQPEVPAIDASDRAWIPIQSDDTPEMEIYEVTDTGATTTLVSGTGNNTNTKIYTGATFAVPFGAAVDGNGNIWVTDRCSYQAATCVTTGDEGYSTLVEINGAAGANSPGTAGQAISPTGNYKPAAAYATNILDDPKNIAIDPSGNLWITNNQGNSVVEVVGAAAPVVTPLSVAAGTNALGTKP